MNDSDPWSDRYISATNYSRECYCMHFCSARFAKCTRARLQGGARGQHIVNHDHRFTVETPARLDRACDIAAAFGGGETCLALAALHACKRAGPPGFAGGGGERLRQP